MTEVNSFRANQSERRAALRKRAADARLAQRRAKAWADEVNTTLASARLPWRTASTWIEQGTGCWCAEFTHLSSGKTISVRLDVSFDSDTARRDELLRLLVV
jgi:hypothetical protein